MCGLVGIFDPAGRPPRESLEPALKELLLDIRHRGPDGEGVVYEEGLALGHRRLAILDVSETGFQPMTSHDGRYVLAYNGEMYNHLDLRASLPGGWRGTSDTETLLEAFSASGLDALSGFCGMFAIALYDRKDRALHLIRDRFGIKPLFYSRRPEGGFVFGSEARAVGRATRAQLRRDMLPDYLSWGYPPPGHTLLEGVFEVGPGEILTLSRSGLQRRQYYALPALADRAPSKAEQDEAFDAAFCRSVREHQLADVPIGVLLSSGVDSSAIAIAAAQSGARLTAFTVRFGDQGLDESAEAEGLARKLGLPVVVLSVPADLDRDTLDAVAASSDLPLADSSNIGTWLIAREASKHVKVLLTGDGADETWAGYETYAATELTSSFAGQALRVVGSGLDSLLGPPRPSGGRPGLRVKLSRFARYADLEPLEAHRRWRTLVDEDSLRSLGLRAADPAPFRKYVEAAAGRTGTNAATALDVATYMVQDELVRLDRMAMAHGLEGRVPFLDHRLVELAFSWAPDIKLHGREGKKPVRRWLANRGFDKPAQARKRGFNHPVASWMTGQAGGWLLDTKASLAALVDPTCIETWVKEHRTGVRDRSYELFALLVLARWVSSTRLPGM